MKESSNVSRWVTWLSLLAELAAANLLWILCCLPVVTIGASTAALSQVTLNMIRGKDSSAKVFLQAFRDHFKQATVLWMVLMLFGGLLGLNVRLALGWQSRWQQLFLSALLVAGVVFVMLLVWLFPIIAQFKNPAANQLAMAFVLSIRYIWYTVPMLIVTLFPLALLLLFPYFWIKSAALWVSVGFALIALFHAKLLAGIFDRLIASGAQPHIPKL